MSKMLRSRLACGLVMSSLTLSVGSVIGPTLGMPGYILPAMSQTTPELKKLTPQFVTEPGCPIEVAGATTAFEIDGFGTPMAARHYIDYRNIGGRPIAAVKFRIAYVAEDGKIHQPYLNAPDSQPLEPGATASQKWRGDKVDPKTSAVKIRVLMVKYSDGSIWESQKVNQTNAQQQEGFVPLQTESPGSDIAENFTPGTPVQFKNYQTPQAGTFPAQSQTGAVPFKSAGTGNPGFDPGAFGTPVQMTTTPAGAGGGVGVGAAAVPGGSWDSPGPAGGAAMPGAAAMPSASGAPSTYAPATSAQPATTYGARPAAPTAPVDPLSQIDAILGNPRKAPSMPAPAAVAPTAVAPTVPVMAPAMGRAAPVSSFPPVPPSMAGAPDLFAAPPTAPSAPQNAEPVLAPPMAVPGAAAAAPVAGPRLDAVPPPTPPVAAPGPDAMAAPSAPGRDATAAPSLPVAAPGSDAMSAPSPGSPMDMPSAAPTAAPPPAPIAPPAARTTGGSMPSSAAGSTGTSGSKAPSSSADKANASLDDLLK